MDYVAPLDNAGGADFVYQLLGQGAKALYSTSRTLNLYFTNADGNPVLGANDGGILLGYNVLLKISRPVVGLSQAEHSTGWIHRLALSRSKGARNAPEVIRVANLMFQ